MQNSHLKRRFFLLACFFNCSFLYAQFTLQKFTKIDEENGLSDNNVQCIFKDSKQFVWIGTESGLDLMDGSGITVFKHEPANRNSISSNNITAITGNKDGLIWIGTRQGLNSFDPSIHLFSYYPLDKKITKDNSTGSVTALAIDKKNGIYAGTIEGLFFLKAGEKNAQRIDFPGPLSMFQKNNYITDLSFDSSGALWITNFTGLWKYLPGKKQPEEIVDAKSIGLSTFLTRLLLGSSGKIWLGTFSKGLKSYDPIKKELLSFGTNENISALAEERDADGKNELWIGEQFVIFDLAHQSFIRLKPSSDFPKNIDVKNVYISADKWLWLCTQKGLYFCNPSKPVLNHHIFSNDITSQQNALLEWNHKMLVTGTGKNFLKSYDSLLNEKDNYSQNIEPDVSCLSLRFSAKDQLTASTSVGIATINLISHKIQFNHLRILTKNISSGNFITNLLEDNEHRLWIFPWRKGIWRSDTANQNFTLVFKNFTSQKGFPKPLVVADAIEDKNKNLWFADLDEGIILYNKITNNFSKPFAKQLGNFYKCYQIIGYQNFFYSFTASEILKWNPDNKSLQVIPLPPEIDKPISSIAFDSSRHLWLATGKGLLEYDPDKKNFLSFTIVDGLVSNDMDGTLYCMQNGTMIYGSPGYLTSFNPVKMVASAQLTPHIRLVQIMVNSKFIPPDQTDKMIFSHDENNINVKWTVTDYNNPLKNQYYYQLKGIDTSWHSVGERGEINLVSLSPGSYTLLLKGENSNGIAASNLIHLFFKIKLPFWRTWWFISAIILFFLSLFYFFYRHRLKEVRRIERLRNKIARDLHDDVGATLSTIMLYGNSIKKKAPVLKKEDIMNIVNKISKSAGEMIDEMNDIVWTINPKNDNMERTISRMQIFASSLLASKEVPLIFDLDEEIKKEKVSMDKRKNCYLIFKEVLNNAIKHSECTAIGISLHKNHHNIEMKITDNGKGFNHENSHSGNGLDNIRQRATEIGGELTIDHPNETGTSVSLVFPLA